MQGTVNDLPSVVNLLKAHAQNAGSIPKSLTNQTKVELTSTVSNQSKESTSTGTVLDFGSLIEQEQSYLASLPVEMILLVASNCNSFKYVNNQFYFKNFHY